MKFPSAVLALLASAMGAQAAMGSLAANVGPEPDSIEGIEKPNPDGLEANACPPAKPLLCPNGGCCARAYPRCCPTACCPESYPYCGNDGRCYAK